MVLPSPALHRLWAAVEGDPRSYADLDVRHPGPHLRSRLDVDDLAVGAIGALLLAAVELAQARGAGRPSAALDARHAAVAFASERHVARGGQTPASTFAPLSRFFPTRDGWIRLHANYPHHRAALLRALETDDAGVATALASLDAEAAEEAIHAAGGVAAAVRTEAEWRSHPQGRAVDERPLVEWLTRAEARWSALRDVPVPRHLPALGLRVVDLTRVIAGPVATRMLAALGADVVRVDPPHLPEDPGLVDDTCAGKRVVDLDLRRSEDAATLDALLADAHVLVTGYRPGALTPFGLDDATVVERHPQLVVASLSAWGEHGPWARRRGFDSLVQAATGIALVEGDDGRPGALPVQALDHATGYLLAATVLRSVAVRERGGPPSTSRLALAGMAADLLRHPRVGDEPPATTVAPAPFQTAVEHPSLRLVAPPGSLAGRPLQWRGAVRHIAPATARWRPGADAR